MKFELYTDVALRSDVPEHRLRRRDIVKLVDHHVVPGGTEGYSIEVFNTLGDTIAVTSVPSSALEALRQEKCPASAPCNGAGEGFPPYSLAICVQKNIAKSGRSQSKG